MVQVLGIGGICFKAKRPGGTSRVDRARLGLDIHRMAQGGRVACS
jgi:hypothetical protein